MAETIYTGTVKKRVNSTLQPTLSTTYSVLLKNGCSIDNPVFYLSAPSFSDNYVIWNGRYYFVTDITYETNTRTAVSCTLDVLATYKSDIVASTQFVSYSSVSGGTWLPDTRIPVKVRPTVSRTTAATSIFSVSGHYILSVVGVNGCKVFAVTESTLSAILNSISTWKTDFENDVMQSLVFADTDLKNLATALARTGAIGNTWENTTQCIRSCHWIPYVINGGTGGVNIWLGDYNTGQSGRLLDSLVPETGSLYVTIPWQFSDWRRVQCEDIYLYIPLVGTISIPSENIAHASTLEIKYSYTLTDGAVSFEVLAGTEVVGTYGANCAAQVPVGILQAVGAGQMLNTIAQGAEKAAAASIGGAVIAAAGIAYDVKSQSMSKNLSCIGGIGGGAGSGLDKSVYCTSVAHDTIVTPSSMQATMGVPTMQPLVLSSCSGFCQCANAHVAIDSEYSIMERVDAYLNSGFYIE